MKWYDNTEYICQKGYERLWMLRRLKGLGASEVELMDVYMKQVRSVLKLAVPVWQPALKKEEARQIEHVQRCALYIILGESYISYDNALNQLECQNLDERRIQLCGNVAKKSLTNPRYTTWFSTNNAPPPNINTRHEATKVQTILNPVMTRTDRFKKSPLPHLTDLLNKLITKK